MISRSGLHGWKEKRSRLLRHGAGVLGRLRSQRPVQRFGKGIEELARGAFHSHATFAEAEQKHAATRRIELKEIRAPQEVRALRMLFLQRFGILAEETCRVLFAVKMQASNENQLFRFFLLICRVTISIPGACQGLRAVVIQKLFKDFFPAKLS